MSWKSDKPYYKADLENSYSLGRAELEHHPYDLYLQDRPEGCYCIIMRNEDPPTYNGWELSSAINYVLRFNTQVTILVRLIISRAIETNLLTDDMLANAVKKLFS